MSGELSVLPSWKRGATAYERLSELALYARAYPEKFEQFVIVNQEILANGNWKLQLVSFRKGGEGLTFTEKLGLLQAGIQKSWTDSCK